MPGTFCKIASRDARLGSATPLGSIVGLALTPTRSSVVKAQVYLSQITKPRWVGAALVGGAVMVWIVANLAASPSSFAFLLFVGVTNGAMYALVALGFSLSYMLIDLINLPHGFVLVSRRRLVRVFAQRPWRE